MGSDSNPATGHPYWPWQTLVTSRSALRFFMNASPAGLECLTENALDPGGRRAFVHPDAREVGLAVFWCAASEPKG
jgi:hypothetical protein